MPSTRTLLLLLLSSRHLHSSHSRFLLPPFKTVESFGTCLYAFLFTTLLRCHSVVSSPQTYHRCLISTAMVYHPMSEKIINYYIYSIGYPSKFVNNILYEFPYISVYPFIPFGRLPSLHKACKPISYFAPSPSLDLHSFRSVLKMTCHGSSFFCPYLHSLGLDQDSSLRANAAPIIMMCRVYT